MSEDTIIKFGAVPVPVVVANPDADAVAFVVVVVGIVVGFVVAAVVVVVGVVVVVVVVVEPVHVLISAGHVSDLPVQYSEGSQLPIN